MKCKLCGLPTEIGKSFHNTTDECVFAHNAHYQDLVDAVAQQRRDVTEAAIRLYQYTPEIVPDGFKTTGGEGMYTPGDETAPFFTESYLYNLMGKEDGRTVLALVHNLLKAMGLDGYDIHALEEKAAREIEKGKQTHRIKSVLPAE